MSSKADDSHSHSSSRQKATESDESKSVSNSGKTHPDDRLSVCSLTGSLDTDLSSVSSKTKVPENAPQPRLCHLKKWPYFQGYGFNLHAERAKIGQHIGKVDVDSPARLAGLREGDLIVEVNNVNVSNENHQQVVKRIRNGFEYDGAAHPDEVVLLVVDPAAEEYYKRLNIIVKNDFNNVLKNVTPPPDPSKLEVRVEAAKDSPRVASEAITVDKNNNNTTACSVKSETTSGQTSTEHKECQSVSEVSSAEVPSAAQDAETPQISMQVDKGKSPTNSSENSINKSPLIPSSSSVQVAKQNSDSKSAKLTNDKVKNHNNNEIDPYKMSAAEFKNYLKIKSRHDAKISTTNMAEKFRIFQGM